MKFTYFKLLGHVISAIWQVTIYFPFLANEIKTKKIQIWCSKLLDIFEIKIKTIDFGDFPIQGALLVSNHISWLDIMVINAVSPVRFVAKSEVKNWPIFGYLADKLGTLYIKRGYRIDTQRSVNDLANAIIDKQTICIFPEGTSTDGSKVLEFKSNLFESVVLSNAVCLPIALSYKNQITCESSNSPAYYGEVGLFESIRNLVNSPPICATVSIGLPIYPSISRKDISLKAWDQVRQMREASFFEVRV